MSYTHQEITLAQIYENKVFFGLEAPTCSLDVDDLTWAKAIWDRNPALSGLFETPHRWILTYGYFDASVRQFCIGFNQHTLRMPLPKPEMQKLYKLATLELAGMYVLLASHGDCHNLIGLLQSIFILHSPAFKEIHNDHNHMIALAQDLHQDGNTTFYKIDATTTHPELIHDGSKALECRKRESFIAQFDPTGIALVQSFEQSSGRSFWTYFGCIWSLVSRDIRTGQYKQIIQTFNDLS